VINGEKWFSSHANFASFLIVLAVTDPEEERHRRMSMFVVPADTPGIHILRNVPVYGHAPDEGTHSYIRYEDVRVPAENLLGERGDGFNVAQTRLGGGRIHHAMRTVGLVKRAFDMMCERALSRVTQGEVLARKQLVQAMIADSWIQIEQFRLLVLRTAWRIDEYNDYQRVRADISAVKAAMPQVLHDVAARALQIHGSLGVSDEMPFGAMVLESFHMGLADGATEVHKTTLARQLLKDHRGSDDLFPTMHLPKQRARAHELYDDLLSASGES
jgi:acyl-CoA dehydrogenase